VTPAAASKITFDDAVDTTAAVVIPDGYGGFTWSNFAIAFSNLNPGSGFDNGTVSGDYVAFNVSGEKAAMNHDGVFTFKSAYITGAWNNGLNVTVTGLLGDAQLYQTTVVVNTTGPTLFNFNWTDIDMLTFDSFGGVNAGLGVGNQFALDDVVFNEQPVPEPASLSLVALGLAGLGLRRWRQRKS